MRILQLCVFISKLWDGIIIWGLTNKSYLGKLTSLQNKAIWAVGGAEWNESSSSLYYKFKVLKLHHVYKYKLAKFMQCVQNKTLPTLLINFFDNLKNNLNLNSRSRTHEKLKVPLFKLSRTQKSVKYLSVTLWNALSLNFKKLSFRKFSTEYKFNLIRNYKLLFYPKNLTLARSISIKSILLLEKLRIYLFYARLAARLEDLCHCAVFLPHYSEFILVLFCVYFVCTLCAKKFNFP